MKRFILLAVCAVAMFAAVPSSQAACLTAEDVQACTDTDNSSYACSHVYAVVTFANSCTYIDNGIPDWHYLTVWGDDYSINFYGYPGWHQTYVYAATACVHVYEATQPDPDFDAELC